MILTNNNIHNRLIKTHLQRSYCIYTICTVYSHAPYNYQLFSNPYLQSVSSFSIFQHYSALSYQLLYVARKILPWAVTSYTFYLDQERENKKKEKSFDS